MDLSSWPGLTLRPSTSEDEELLRAIYASTREEELSQMGWQPAQREAFLRLQFDAQHRWYRTRFAKASFDLILEHGQPVGRLYVDRQAHDLNVIDIALLPTHRRRGLGTFLMHAVLAEALQGGQIVNLHVEAFNPARRLYDRLGFRPVGEDSIYVAMRWESLAAAGLA